MANNNKKTKIVILGAGFGGVYCYLQLCKDFKDRDDISITLVNNKDHFLFTPLLHEVATGSLTTESIIEPLRRIVKCNTADLYIADVQNIDNEKKFVQTSKGDIAYDYLVASLGATTNFFGTKGAAKHSFTLKTAKEAITLKRHFIDMFEMAAHLTDKEEIKKHLQFVVIGGGATGVELAGEMADFLLDTLASKYPSRIAAEVKLTVVHSGDSLVSAFPPKFGTTSLLVLKKHGVDVQLNTRVNEVGKDFVQLNNGQRINTNTAIWVAGVKPNVTPFAKGVKDERGKIVVNKFLQIEQYPEIFVLGDCCYLKDPKKDGPLPALAQVAEKEGEAVANNITRAVQGKKPKAFVYKSSGTLLSLGKMMAAGQVKGFFFSGKMAWFFWRTVYFSKHITASKKAKVAFDWLIELFSERDISKY